MAVRDIFQAVLEFKDAEVCRLIEEELNAGTDLQVILSEGLISVMDEVGRRFTQGKMFVPEMLRAARAMKGGLEIMKPLFGSKIKPIATIVIGTVAGDLHDIGKNLVSMMLDGAGFKVIDLGVNVEPERFIEAVLRERADLAALSALLTTTMPAMKQTVASLKKKDMGIKTLVGGAPVTQKFADMIGADGYAEDAPGTVEIARRLISLQIPHTPPPLKLRPPDLLNQTNK